MNRELTEMLKGCRPVKDSEGNIIVQSIMNMQIVCLTADAEYSLDSRFANPFTALQAGNSSYGQISFANKENKEVYTYTNCSYYKTNGTESWYDQGWLYS